MNKLCVAAYVVLFASSPDLAFACVEPVAPEPGTVPTGEQGAYVPLTKDDNSPWRFDMRQGGKRMTSVEFDAWMKAKGIRIATGKPLVQAAPDPVDPPEASAPDQSNQ